MTECSKCGDCCENIWLPRDPQGLKDALAEYEAMDQTKPVVQDNIRSMGFILNYWTYNGPTNDESDGHTYECVMFDAETRLCTAHDKRPPICSLYPYYNRKTLDGKILPERCSYQADTRTRLPIVSVT